MLDPVCGAGTIAIEASYLALNKSSMIHRKKNEFGCHRSSYQKIFQGSYLYKKLLRGSKICNSK